MAVSIAILSEFADAGIKRAVAEFKQLEGVGAKAQFALKKAAIPAAAALTALAAGAVDFAKAAMEDEAAAAALAGQLRRVTSATDAQIKANEDLISKMVRTFGVSDGDLRPALAKLATGTKDLAEAQKVLRIAMDVSAATGKDLGTVADALSKAYGGNYRALQQLSPELKAAIKDGASLSDVMQILNQNFGGAAADRAATSAGKFAIFNERMGELKETLGAALLPVIEKLLPLLEKMLGWAERNPTAFTVIAAGIAAVAAAIVAVNVAMALNPFTLIAAGVAAAAVGLVALYNKSETFRNILKEIGEVFKWVWDYVIKPILDLWLGQLKLIITTIQKAIDLLKKLPSPGDKSFWFGPWLGRISPLSMPSGGGGDTSMTTGINVYVNGGDPNAVVDAIKSYNRQTGAIPATFITP